MDDRVRLYFALCGYGEAAEIASCFTDNAIIYATNSPPIKGKHNIGVHLTETRKKWFGAKWTVDSAIVEKNHVCVEGTMIGKKEDGELVVFRGCEIYHFEG